MQSDLQTQVRTAEELSRLAITIWEEGWDRFYPNSDDSPAHGAAIEVPSTYADWLRYELDHLADVLLTESPISPVSRLPPRSWWSFTWRTYHY